MPSLSSLSTLCLLALGAFATPLQKRSCMSDEEAQQVATNWGTLIANYTKALADAALSPSITDYSESVNTLINSCPQGSAALTLPLLAPTFSNRTAFEAGQGQQAPINFQQLNIWHSCDTVVIRWESTNTAPIASPKPVVGLIVMETCQASAGGQFSRLIDTVYSEFDAGAWLQNLQAAGICNTTASS